MGSEALRQPLDIELPLLLAFFVQLRPVRIEFANQGLLSILSLFHGVWSCNTTTSEALGVKTCLLTFRRLPAVLEVGTAGVT